MLNCSWKYSWGKAKGVALPFPRSLGILCRDVRFAHVSCVLVHESPSAGLHRTAACPFLNATLCSVQCSFEDYPPDSSAAKKEEAKSD